jgi:hypothetical protein
MQVDGRVEFRNLALVHDADAVVGDLFCIQYVLLIDAAALTHASENTALVVEIQWCV